MIMIKQGRVWGKINRFKHLDKNGSLDRNRLHYSYVCMVICKTKLDLDLYIQIVCNQFILYTGNMQMSQRDIYNLEYDIVKQIYAYI